MGFQPAFDVGVQVHTEDIREPKERYVTVSTPKREKKTSSEDQGDYGDESHSSSDEADRDKDRKKKKGLTRNYLDTVKKMPMLASPRELMAAFVQTPVLHQRNPYPIYPYAGTPLSYAMGPMPFPSPVIMRERPRGLRWISFVSRS